MGKPERLVTGNIYRTSVTPRPWRWYAKIHYERYQIEDKRTLLSSTTEELSLHAYIKKIVQSKSVGWM
jgi:hypothetical protein